MQKELKIWAVSEDDSIEYVSLTSDKLEGAMNVMHKSFFAYEKVCIAVELHKDLKAAKELDELILKTIRDGVSIIAVEKNTGKVVGVALNKLEVKGGDAIPYFKKYIENCTCPSAKALVQFMIDIDEAVDFFQLCKTNCLLEIMFLATLPEFAKRGIAKKLCQASIELGQKLLSGENIKRSIDNTVLALKPVPTVIFGIFTSFISQNIAKQLGFIKVHESSYEKYSFEGKSFASKINSDTPSITFDYKYL